MESNELVDYLIDGLAPLGGVLAKRFFGGTALTLNGVQFAFVMRGELYLRVDGQSRPAFEERGLAPFRYSTRARAVNVASYYEAPGEVLDDPDELCLWARNAYQAALRVGKEKGKGRGKRSK